jgi:hypothetical protein
MIFTEGTILMHSGGIGHAREEIIYQVREKEKTLFQWSTYVPIGNAAVKLDAWRKQGAEIFYLTSRIKPEEVMAIRKVLKKNRFPDGQLLYRRKGQQYRDIAENLFPDILVEDDCESIGGIAQMTITHIKPEIKDRIKSIAVKEFGGIDHLPDAIAAL